MSGGFIVVLAILAFAAVTIFKGVRIVPQGYKWIVQRLGKYHTTLNPGLNFVIPYVDEVAYKVTTKDMWTGMCKGLAAGGVWELDQIEAVVK